MRIDLKYIAIIGVFILITSCKAKRNVITEITPISSKKIIKNHYDNSFDEKTVSARIKAKYSDHKKSLNISIKLRLEKDKSIWMSATKLGIPVAKVLITPETVSYYEKLTKTYFKGDFSLLSDWLGVDLNFEKVQNLLLGQAVLNLKSNKYSGQILNNTYLLQPKKSLNMFDILFWINPTNYKISKQEIRKEAKKQALVITYPHYSSINGHVFPEKIDIRAINVKKTLTINMQFRSVEFNKDLTFPFRIPNGYKELKLP